MANYPFLELATTDNTLVATILDGANGETGYSLYENGWAPGIAARRTSPLQGPSPYDDVTETISVWCLGTTTAEALARVARLAALLDAADAHAADATLPAVVVRYAPQGSTQTFPGRPLEALILGRAPGDTSTGMTLPATWIDNGAVAQIGPVQLVFRRRGLWSGLPETQTTAATANPVVLRATFATAAALPSPISLTIGANGTAAADGPISLPGAGSQAERGALLVGEKNMIHLVALSGVAQGGAAGGAVARITPTTANEWTPVTTITLPAALQRISTLAVVMVARCSTASVAYDTALGGAADDVISDASVQTIPATTDHQVVLLGMHTRAINRLTDPLTVFVRVSTLSGSPSIDVDTVAVLGITPAATLLAIPPESSDGTLAHYAASVAIDAAALRNAPPLVTGLPIRGPLGLAHQGYDVEALLLLPTPHRNDYRHVVAGSSTTNAPYLHQLTVTRRRAMIVPE